MNMINGYKIMNKLKKLRIKHAIINKSLLLYYLETIIPILFKKNYNTNIMDNGSRLRR